MKINNSNLSFQKKLIARCNIVKNNEKSPCNIFELDPNDKKDTCYFNQLHNSEDWRKNSFFRNIEECLIIGIDSRYYTIENQKGKCLGACQIIENDKDNSDELLYLETTTSNSIQNPERNTKYIGETLLSFAVGMAKKAKRNFFRIIDPTRFALPFYLKLGFREDFDEDNLCINKNYFDNVIQKNQTHVGEIEYIA